MRRLEIINFSSKATLKLGTKITRFLKSGIKLQKDEIKTALKSKSKEELKIINGLRKAVRKSFPKFNSKFMNSATNTVGATATNAIRSAKIVNNLAGKQLKNIFKFEPKRLFTDWTPMKRMKTLDKKFMSANKQLISELDKKNIKAAPIKELTKLPKFKRDILNYVGLDKDAKGALGMGIRAVDKSTKKLYPGWNKMFNDALVEIKS